VETLLCKTIEELENKKYLPRLISHFLIFIENGGMTTWRFTPVSK